MKKYLKQAKDEGLNWQTALIEDTETEIKLLIRAAVFGAWTWAVLNRRITELVNKTAEEIEIEELKERARISLLAFATIAYRTFAAAMSGVNVKILPQVVKYTESGDKRAERIIRQAYRSDYFDTAQPLNIYAKDYMEKVQGALDELAQSTAKDDYSSRVSLRNISEMSVRWEEKQKARQKLIDDGEDLVWISTHANCSVRCQKYQGQLYSLSGKKGFVDGIEYNPLTKATDVLYTTKSGKTTVQLSDYIGNKLQHDANLRDNYAAGGIPKDAFIQQLNNISKRETDEYMSKITEEQRQRQAEPFGELDNLGLGL